LFRLGGLGKHLNYIGSTIGNKNTPSSSQKLNSKSPKTPSEHYSKKWVQALVNDLSF
jgi:hypothetical protein